ncbi:unnamed protein product [Symbiodinium sp. CCMP2592]|nr:unnamed protein product [Symbiodinium sp. CCMP2592]
MPAPSNSFMVMANGSRSRPVRRSFCQRACVSSGFGRKLPATLCFASRPSLLSSLAVKQRNPQQWPRIPKA